MPLAAVARKAYFAGEIFARDIFHGNSRFHGYDIKELSHVRSPSCREPTASFAFTRE